MLALVLGALTIGTLGCLAEPARSVDDVADALVERTGYGPSVGPTPAGVPETVDLEDGLSQDESVALALWNNPRFQADLARLGFARADLAQAGLLSNPVLSLLFPVGPKQLEASVNWPLADLWHRRRRVALAQGDLEQVAESLVQSGLDLALEVKIAFTDLVLARETAAIADEATQLQDTLERISAARLSAGDISTLEMVAVQADAHEARLTARQRATDLEAARLRLLSLLGLPAWEPGFTAIVTPPADIEPPAFDQLLAEAMASRPDLRAAELAIESAGKKAGLARSEYLTISAVIDANAEGREGFEIGPGLGVGLPVFDRGQPARIRAAAELRQATYGYTDVRNVVITRVRESYMQFVQAREALEVSRDSIAPLRLQALRETETAFESGEVAYLDVVRSQIAMLDTRSREAQASAAVRRAQARLENSVGSDLRDPSASTDQDDKP